MAIPEYRSGNDGKAKFGSIEQDITQWSGTWEENSSRFGTSKSQGWLTGVYGTKGASGELTGKVPVGGNPPEEFQNVELTLVGGGDDRTGTARLTSVQVTVNADTGEAVEWKANWESIGPWTKVEGGGSEAS
jgi:hypothetical protein